MTHAAPPGSGTSILIWHVCRGIVVLTVDFPIPFLRRLSRLHLLRQLRPRCYQLRPRPCTKQLNSIVSSPIPSSRRNQPPLRVLFTSNFTLQSMHLHHRTKRAMSTGHCRPPCIHSPPECSIDGSCSRLATSLLPALLLRTDHTVDPCAVWSPQRVVLLFP